MSSQYLQQVLAQKSAAPLSKIAVENAAQALFPLLQSWGNQYIEDISLSGSYAKGTAVQGGTDIDIFISLSSSLNDSLADIYNTLYNALTQGGYPYARKQNVSIGITVNGYKVDLVPGKRQSLYNQDHSLYKRKTNSWIKTNIKKHIELVRNSGRLSEIKAMKIWRNNKGLEFSSFHLELTVIEALRGSGIVTGMNGDLSRNIVKILSYLQNDFQTAKIVDPANTNNIISDDMTIAEKQAIVQAAKRSFDGKWTEFIS